MSLCPEIVFNKAYYKSIELRLPALRSVSQNSKFIGILGIVKMVYHFFLNRHRFTWGAPSAANSLANTMSMVDAFPLTQCSCSLVSSQHPLSFSLLFKSWFLQVLDVVQMFLLVQIQLHDFYVFMHILELYGRIAFKLKQMTVLLMQQCKLQSLIGKMMTDRTASTV